MAIDSISKMIVDENTTEFKTEYNGKMYFFCAGGCKRAFEENPEKFI